MLYHILAYCAVFCCLKLCFGDIMAFGSKILGVDVRHSMQRTIKTTACLSLDGEFAWFCECMCVCTYTIVTCFTAVAGSCDRHV